MLPSLGQIFRVFIQRDQYFIGRNTLVKAIDQSLEKCKSTKLLEDRLI